MTVAQRGVEIRFVDDNFWKQSVVVDLHVPKFQTVARYGTRTTATAQDWNVVWLYAFTHFDTTLTRPKTFFENA